MEEAPNSGLSRGLINTLNKLWLQNKREKLLSSAGGSVRLGSFYCAGCQVIFCLFTCISGHTTSLWQGRERWWSQPSLGTGNVSGCHSSKIRCGQQRAHRYHFDWAEVLEKPLRLEVQQVALSRNSKTGSIRLSFFHFLLQEQPYP